MVARLALRSLPPAAMAEYAQSLDISKFSNVSNRMISFARRSIRSLGLEIIGVRGG